MAKNSNLMILPDFRLDNSKIPDVRVKSIRLQNFKVFDDCTFDFVENNAPKSFVCFSGPNGCGKSTLLDVIQLVFTRFDGRDSEDIKRLLSRLIRHVDGQQKHSLSKEDFLITANIHSSIGDYEIQLNKNGFIKDHPEDIKMIVYRLCFYARFDQELNRFQLARSQWSTFKDLFEAVTGFEIKEKTTLFDESEDPVQADILKQYVLSFHVHKPDEIISHNECSAGERKIIKSFSTLLNKEYIPSVVCVDNVEMHVESGRHIQLIESMKRCFPKSQIFATTHSYQISKNFGERTQLYDLRLMKTSELIKKEPWRLYVADEIKDNISKIKSMNLIECVKERKISDGEKLRTKLMQEKNIGSLLFECEEFMKVTCKMFLDDISSLKNNDKTIEGL